MKLDTTHDMYLPDRRSRASIQPKMARSPVDAPSREQKEAWMREKQVKRQTKRLVAAATRAEIERVLVRVCDELGVARASLLSDSRMPVICEARRLICRKLYRKASAKDIGHVLRIHHASVIYHWRTQSIEPAGVIPCPDLSGEWAI